MAKRAESFEGWSFLEWLKGNGKTIKEVLKVGVPLAVAWAGTSNPTLVVLITSVGKLLIDCAEYYLKARD